MRKELFDDLIESVNEAVAIKRGLVAPARVTTFEMPDVKAIRTKAKLKQNEFAQVVGVSPSLVQAWEQQREHPPAAVLNCCGSLKSILTCLTCSEQHKPLYWGFIV